MRQSSWIALAIIFLIVFFAANNTTQSGVKPDWYVNSALIAQRSGGNFIAGSNITLTGVDDIGNDRVNITIAATGGATSNSFATIDTPSGTDPVADSSTDTLQLLVTGTDLSITGNAAADSVTFDILSHAGTDITVDLEEEGQINATIVTGDATNDRVLLGTGASAAAWTIVIDCIDANGKHLNYDQSTNTFSCGTSTSGLTQAYQIIQEEGTPLTQRFKLNFIGSGITCVDDAGDSRTNCTIAAGTFSGEVDDTTNDALTFTTDDASPPADTVRNIYAKNTNDLQYTVPGTGVHTFTIGGTGAAVVLNDDRVRLSRSQGTPTGFAANDTTDFEQWNDDQLNRPFIRLNQYNTFGAAWPRHQTMVMPDGAGAPSIFGDAITTLGTASFAAPDSNGIRTTFTTAASIDSNAGPQGELIHSGELNVLTWFVFKLDQNANERAFIGLTDQTCATTLAADDPAGHRMGISYSTTRGDTNWQLSTKNNVTQTLTDTANTIDTATHTLLMYYDNLNSRLIYSLDGAAQAIITATLPTSSIDMRFCAAVRTLEAVAKAIQVGEIFIEDDGPILP